MAEYAIRQKVDTVSATQQHPFNVYFEEMDVNTADYGHQGYVYKTILDAGVATSAGSPVGSTQASGGSVVTPDQSDAGSAGIRFRGGGIAPVAVAAGATKYGWIQCVGINRVAAICTGALAANAQGEWTADDTIAAFSNSQFIFCRALVAASGGSVAAGGLLLFG